MAYENKKSSTLEIGQKLNERIKVCEGEINKRWKIWWKEKLKGKKILNLWIDASILSTQT